jgi:hypothetical protein
MLERNRYNKLTSKQIVVVKRKGSPQKSTHKLALKHTLVNKKASKATSRKEISCKNSLFNSVKELPARHFEF